MTTCARSHADDKRIKWTRMAEEAGTAVERGGAAGEIDR